MTRPSLRVLMTADTVGGVWTYACELIGALGPLGVEVTLATMGAPLSTSQARTVAALPNVDVEESRYALEWMPDPWRDVDAAGEWLLALAARTRPDMVHINGYVHAALPFDVPVICVAHSCVCSWFRAVKGAEAGPEWTEYRNRVGRGLRASAAVVGPTAAILRAVFEAHDLARPWRVIPNARSSARWRPTKKEWFVLSAGRLWDEAKGLADLEACAPSIGWPIRVAGSLAAPAELPAVTATRVEVLGELAPEMLATWMARSSIYALPARYEPFGLSVLEAALSGNALVLGEIETLRETWAGAALFVPPGDVDALTFALNALIRDPLRRGALAASARARAHGLTPHRMGCSYRALYDEVAFALHQEEASA
jgi:glycogen synthase